MRSVGLGCCVANPRRMWVESQQNLKSEMHSDAFVRAMVLCSIFFLFSLVPFYFFLPSRHLFLLTLQRLTLLGLLSLSAPSLPQLANTKRGKSK